MILLFGKNMSHSGKSRIVRIIYKIEPINGFHYHRTQKCVHNSNIIADIHI